jgi:L-2-hydroxycarboxylate dehydrogenase (NAD+)
LATIVEILSANLQNVNFLTGLTGFYNNGTKQPFGIGHFFQAIAIDAFTSAEEFKKRTGDILRSLRNSKRAYGHERIYTAVEKEAGESIKSYCDGIKISSNLADELNKLSKKYNLPKYHF